MAAGSGRVLRAIVPGTANADSAVLPVALRAVSRQTAALGQAASRTSQLSTGHQHIPDAPIRRQVGGTVRPQYLPAPASAGQSSRQPTPAGQAVGRSTTRPDRQAAAQQAADRAVGFNTSTHGTGPHSALAHGGSQPSASQHGISQHGTGNSGPAAAGRTVVGSTGRYQTGAVAPVIRRSAVLPSTVRAAALNADRPVASTGGPAGFDTPPARRLPGGLATSASGRDNSEGSGRLGAFVQRSMVVAPPRVSVRPADLVPAAGGPPVPASVRSGRQAPSPTPSGGTAVASQPGVEVDGPVIRRSLSGAAHSLFRNLLRSPGAVGPGAHSDPVQSGSAGMFSSFPQHGPGPDEPSVIRRLRESGGNASEARLPGHDSDEDSPSPAMRSRDFDELIDRIVDKLERRITDDLERRGRRHLPEVF